MDEGKHTPGPWTVDETYDEPSDIVAPDGFAVAQVDAQPVLNGWHEKLGGAHWSERPGKAYIDRPRAEVEANARLIAAAPEMKEALGLVLRFHAGGLWTPENAEEWERITGSRDATTKAMCDHIRAVLRKATLPASGGAS